MNCVYRSDYESGLRNNEHYVSSTDFFIRPYFLHFLSSAHCCEDRFHIRFFMRSSHIWFSYIFTIVYTSLHGFIWDQHNDQLPVGLLAQLSTHCTGIAEIMGSTPVEAWFFSSSIFTSAAYVVFITAEIAFIFTSYRFVRSYLKLI